MQLFAIFTTHMRKFIIGITDFFYPPVSKIMSRQTFRYAACGGGNTVLGLSIFYICFYFIFNGSIIDLGFHVFEPHSLSLLVSSGVCFIVGFALNKYVVFTSSYLRGKIQLFRYLLSFAVNLILNYFLLKLLVEYWNWEAMLSQIVTITVITLFSYLSQKHFTFK